MSGAAVPGNMDSFYERLERVESNPTKIAEDAPEAETPKQQLYKKQKPSLMAWALTISVLVTLVLGFAYSVLPVWVLDIIFGFIGSYFEPSYA
jgi:hypothetical protein